jgi:hypothetical protein
MTSAPVAHNVILGSRKHPQGDEMLTSPTAAASRPDAIGPVLDDHASLQTPVLGGGVSAATGTGEALGIASASPEPVLITEQQVMFATAAAAAPRGWIVMLWQRLSLRSATRREPRRSSLRLRPSYIEHAAMAREMERL